MKISPTIQILDSYKSIKDTTDPRSTSVASLRYFKRFMYSQQFSLTLIIISNEFHQPGSFTHCFIVH